MRIHLVLCLFSLAACTPKTESSDKSPPPATPLILDTKMAPRKCDQALSAIPIYKEKNDMFSEIFLFYKNYNDCMDAGIAEGMEALTTTVLSKQWDRLKSWKT